MGYTYLMWLDHSLTAAGLKVESGNTLASEFKYSLMKFYVIPSSRSERYLSLNV